MKKTLTTLTLLLALTLGASAQNAGLFHHDYVSIEEYYYDDHNDGHGLTPGLPNHNMDGDQDAPLGSGVALLLGMGAAYVIAKKRKEN